MVKVILAMPPDTPVTIPEASTVAMAVLLLLHVPPEEEPESGSVLPEQMGPPLPVIMGVPFTVMALYA